jgi:hypothetical protein
MSALNAPISILLMRRKLYVTVTGDGLCIQGGSPVQVVKLLLKAGDDPNRRKSNCNW